MARRCAGATTAGTSRRRRRGSTWCQSAAVESTPVDSAGMARRSAGAATWQPSRRLRSMSDSWPSAAETPTLAVCGTTTVSSAGDGRTSARHRHLNDATHQRRQIATAVGASSVHASVRLSGGPCPRLQGGSLRSQNAGLGRTLYILRLGVHSTRLPVPPCPRRTVATIGAGFESEPAPPCWFVSVLCGVRCTVRV